jgi:hypothetical protein
LKKPQAADWPDPIQRLFRRQLLFQLLQPVHDDIDFARSQLQIQLSIGNRQPVTKKTPPIITDLKKFSGIRDNSWRLFIFSRFTGCAEACQSEGA